MKLLEKATLSICLLIYIWFIFSLFGSHKFFGFIHEIAILIFYLPTAITFTLATPGIYTIVKYYLKVDRNCRGEPDFIRLMMDFAIVIQIHLILRDILPYNKLLDKNLIAHKISFSLVLIIVIILSLFRPAFALASNIVSREKAQEIIEALYYSKPVFKFTATGYNEIKRIRKIEAYEKDGVYEQEHEIVETREEKVFEVQEYWDYFQYRNSISLSEFKHLPKDSIISLSILIEIHPSGERDRIRYEQDLSRFKASHKYRSDKVYYQEYINLDNANRINHMFIFSDPNEVPFFINPFFYLLISLTPFCFVYSRCMESVAVPLKRKLVKCYSAM